MKKLEVYLRIDHINPVHVYCSLFVDHGKAGDLTFRIGEYQSVATMLGMGADILSDNVVFRTDNERFRKWTEKQAKAEEEG